MPTSELWCNLSADDWSAFARSWLAELRDALAEESGEYGQRVVLMNFTATAEQQWAFILAAVDAARSDEDLSHIAAGPLEHLLGNHGETYIGAVEEMARESRTFARALTGVWQHTMSDVIWARVQKLKESVPNPL
jgi:hypothetical protein